MANFIANDITIIIGNESCDLDSAVSTITYAYYLYWKNEQKISNSPNDAHKEKIFLPILNIKKDELPLKTEVLYFLKKMSVPLSLLICRDEIDIELLTTNNDVKIVLVDHHILSEADKGLVSYVVQIFDHRPKDVSSWTYNESVKSKISIVGSCTTLICSEIIIHASNEDFLIKNKDVAHLLYGTIVLDTANFLPSADRARPLDFQMAEVLEIILSIDDKENFRKKLFSELLNAKTDHSTLSSYQLLRKDLKVVNNIPIPGLPMLVETYLKRKDYMAAVELFCKKYNYTTIVIMGMEIRNDKIKRDMALFSVNDSKISAKTLIKHLVKASNPNLGLIETECGKEIFSHFIQTNTKASRKQILPLIKSVPN